MQHKSSGTRILVLREEKKSTRISLLRLKGYLYKWQVSFIISICSLSDISESHCIRVHTWPYTRVHLQEFLFLISPQFVPHVKGHIYSISLTCMVLAPVPLLLHTMFFFNQNHHSPPHQWTPILLSSLGLTGTAPRNYPRLGIPGALVTEWHLLLDYLPHACQLHLSALQLNWGYVGSWCPCGFVFH